MTAPTRRAAMIVATAFAAGLLLGWLLFGGRESRQTAASPATTVGPAPAGATHVSFGQFGVSMELPHGWGSEIKKGVLDLAAPDHSVSVAIAMAPGRSDVHRLGRQDRLQLERLFHARVVSRTRSKIGTFPALISELRGRTVKGQPVRILSSGLTSRWRTYSIETFTVPQPAAQRALEFDTLMSTLRFRAPR